MDREAKPIQNMLVMERFCPHKTSLSKQSMTVG